MLRGFAAGQAAVQARTAGKTLKIEDGSIEAGVEAQFDGRPRPITARRSSCSTKAANDELRYIALVDRALMRFQRGRLDEAVADLEEAIRLNGTQYIAFASLAQVLQRQKKWDEAVERFTQAIAAQARAGRRSIAAGPRSAGARRPVAGAPRGGLARPGGRDPVREAGQSRAGAATTAGAASCSAATGGSRRPWRPATRP